MPTPDDTYDIGICCPACSPATREAHRPAAKPGHPPLVDNILDVNGCDVAIEVYREAGDGYKIVSMATSYDGVGVSIDSYAVALDYSYLLDSALSSYGDITLRSCVEVYGNVTYNGELDNKGELC